MDAFASNGNALFSKAKSVGSEIRFVDLASRVNAEMPAYVVDRAVLILNSAGKATQKSRLLVIGVGYKKNIPDIRESPALEIIEALKKLGANVCYHDPLVHSLSFESFSLRSVSLNPKVLSQQDLILIITPHSMIDYSLIIRKGKRILDTRNALAGLSECKRKIFFL